MNATLVSLYEKYSGNRDDIFDDLGEDPGKAKVGAAGGGRVRKVELLAHSHMRINL